MNVPPAIRVGGEIDAFCNKCQLNLAHTILAMVGSKVVKVKCNTCDSEHHYRGQQPLEKAQSFAAPKKSSSGGASKSASRSSSSVVKVNKLEVAWDDAFKGKDVTKARKYSPKEPFKVEDVVNHPTFGLGLVVAVRDEKIDVVFKLGEKTLIHAKGAPPEQAPVVQKNPTVSTDVKAVAPGEHKTA
jgi:hypothetical protein